MLILLYGPVSHRPAQTPPAANPIPGAGRSPALSLLQSQERLDTKYRHRERRKRRYFGPALKETEVPISWVWWRTKLEFVRFIGQLVEATKHDKSRPPNLSLIHRVALALALRSCPGRFGSGNCVRLCDSRSSLSALCLPEQDHSRDPGSWTRRPQNRLSTV